MADIARLLAKAQGKWKSAEVRERGALPAGRYQFKLDRIKDKSLLCEDSDGKVRARIALEVVTASDEKLVGRRVTKSWNLFDEAGEPDEMGFSILKSELSTLGADVESLDASEIPSTLESLLGSIVDAQVVNKTGDDGVERQNIYLNGLASRGDAKSPAKTPGKRRV